MRKARYAVLCLVKPSTQQIVKVTFECSAKVTVCGAGQLMFECCGLKVSFFSEFFVTSPDINAGRSGNSSLF